MNTVLEFCKPSKTSPIPQFCCARVLLARAATFLFILFFASRALAIRPPPSRWALW